MMSFAFSMPTDRRIRSGATPASISCSSVNWRCVWLAGWRRSTGVRYVGHDADHLQVIHKADRIFAGTFQAESDHATSPVRHVFLCQIVSICCSLIRESSPSNPARLPRAIRQPAGRSCSVEAYAGAGFRVLNSRGRRSSEPGWNLSHASTVPVAFVI